MFIVRPSSVCLSVCYGCIVAKRCEIGPKLLLITNRKSHIGFQITCKSSTLDDLGRPHPSDSWAFIFFAFRLLGLLRRPLCLLRTFWRRLRYGWPYIHDSEYDRIVDKCILITNRKWPIDFQMT